MNAADRRRLAPAILACAAAACAEAPPPPPAVARVEAPPAPPPPPAARWVESGGATMVGPKAGRGTVVLIGGRRALMLADGAMESEKAPSPEPLADLVLVPAPGGARLVGRGAHGLYRFDDPMGAPAAIARSEPRITRMGAWPGAVAIWTDRSELPRFVDIETGKERPVAALPDLPLRAVAFADERRGAGVFEVIGLAVTADGGASWRPAKGASARDTLAVTGFGRRGDAVRAFAFADGPDAAVDLDGARLGAMEPLSAGANEPAIVRWIRASGRDPLEAAASGGLDLPSGGALVASHGMIARVEPKTGAIGELIEIAHGKWLPCSAGRAAGTAWVACTMPDSAAGADMFDPFGVMRVTIGEPKLALGRPDLMRNGEAELRVSPSGGAMLAAPCKSDDGGQVCVRQPDGAWKTVSPEADLIERGAGPLVDGRVAFLRGLFDGDDPPEPAAGEDDDPGRTKRLHVASVGPGGKERVIATIPFTLSRGAARAQSPIEEDTDRTLHFVIEDGEGPYSVIAVPGRETPSVQRVPDAVEARLRAGRGIAVGEGHVLASLDGGASWSDVPATPAVIEAARAIAAGGEPPEMLAVSEVGARIGPMLRLGWGPPEGGDKPEAPADKGASAPSIAASEPPPVAPERTLRCTGAGAAAGLPPLSAMAEARQLLAGKSAAEKGKKRDPNVWAARIGAMETVAMMEEEAPDKREGKWSFRWHDPREIGGKVRAATVKFPPAMTGSASLRFAASDGGRALFALRAAGNKTRLVRVRPGGAAEVVEVPQDLAPSGGVVFGADRGEPIAWIHDTHVIAWVLGERPRVIAEIAAHGARTLGTPTAAGVPLIVGSLDWALVRVLPIPAFDKASADKAPPPVPVALDGWTRIQPVKLVVGSLPACGARPKGTRLSFERRGLRAEIDGVAESASTAIYELRLAPGEMCVEALSAMLTVGRKGASQKPAAPKGAPPKPLPAAPGASFVRVDFAGKKAEGGARGLAPDAEVRRMKCALEG